MAHPSELGLEQLIGRLILSVHLSDDATLIQFETDAGLRSFYAWTGCICDESWFNHFSSVDLLLGQRVRDVIVRAEKEDLGTRQEVDKIYGFTIVTPLGYADLEMRNSSNGYYGGMLTLVDDAEIEPSSHLVTRDF